MDKQIKNIKQWAVNHELVYLNPTNQLIKLTEETGELASAFNRMDKEKVIDSVGDTIVVLNTFCMQYGIDIEDCLDHAWNEIKDRQGVIKNGVLIKNEELGV